MTPPPPRKKSLALPLIGLLALLPGLVMYGFAKGEATRLASDWVYLSAPLLLLGGAAAVLLLQRLWSKPGLIAGALGVGGALIFLTVSLNASITQRVRWQEASRQLRDTQAFCDGKPAPNPRAMAFDPKGRNGTVFFHSGPSGHAEAMYASELRAWEPSEYQIDQAALVGCLTEKRTVVERCQGYEGGAIAVRTRIDLEAKLYSIQTGELVFEQTFPGTTPRACAGMESFYGKSKELAITGERVAEAEALKALTAKLR